MTDRELLEAAARAALMWKDAFSLDDEWNPIWDDEKGFYLGWGTGWWNPLLDDGDALRLAVKLKLCLTVRDSDTRAHKYGSNSKRRQHHESQGDPYAATRRAIVRAAAIGAHKEGA